MSWIFEGSCGGELSLSLSEEGHWSVHGTATQDCLPVTNDLEVVRHVRGLQGLWSIHSINDAERHYDGAGFGLKKFFESAGGNGVAMIHYFPRSKEYDAAIGLNVLLSPELASEVAVTFRAMLGNSAIRYVVSPNFHGITEHRTEHSPAIGEFLHPELLKQKPYFSERVGITFKTAQLDTIHRS